MNKVNKCIIALAVVLPTLLEVIDTSVVNVSLDHIRGSLSAGIDEATWAITAYLVSNAIIIPLTGWLSRVFGRKRYLLFSVTLFTFSSFMCGSATTLSMLVFFRMGIVPVEGRCRRISHTSVPSSSGSGVGHLDIGERGLSNFKSEISKANRECVVWRESWLNYCYFRNNFITSDPCLNHC